MKNSIAVIIVICLLYSCKSAEIKPYSYKMVTYTITNGQREYLPVEDRLISFGDYLFEFKIKVINKKEVFMISRKIELSTRFDTIGVYLLNSKTRLFYEFDTFALSGRIVNVGKFSNKEFGQKILDQPSENLKKYKEKPLKENLLNGIKLYFYDTLTKKIDGKDSGLIKLEFLKDQNFISHYKLNEGEFSDAKYCLVGFSFYYADNKTEIVNTIDSFRILTPFETRICADMVKKMKNTPIKSSK